MFSKVFPVIFPFMLLTTLVVPELEEEKIKLNKTVSRTNLLNLLQSSFSKPLTISVRTLKTGLKLFSLKQLYLKFFLPHY